METLEQDPFISEMFWVFKILAVAKNMGKVKKEIVELDGSTDMIGKSKFKDAKKDYEVEVVATKINKKWESFTIKMTSPQEGEVHSSYISFKDPLFEIFPIQEKNIVSGLNHFFSVKE